MNLGSDMWSLAKRTLFPATDFSRRVITLIGGTGLAQAMPILAAPILSRLYSATDFGVFALFMAICSILATFVSGRYELAIVLPSTHEEAASLTMVSLRLALGASLALLIVAIVAHTFLVAVLHNPQVGLWLYFVPLGVFSTAAFQAISYWLIRQREFKRLAANRVIRAVSTVSLMVMFGASRALPGGLILGTVMGQALGALMVYLGARTTLSAAASGIGRADLLASMKRYKSFPKYSIPAGGINALTGDMPVFFLASFFGPAAAGFFGLAQRILAGPLSIISGAFADVFKQQASADFAAVGNCRAVWRLTFWRLTVLAVLPLLVLLFAAPRLFSIVFGANWRTAGEYAQVMAPYVMLGFVASPLSRTVYVAEKLGYDLVWQTLLLFFTAGGLLVGGRTGQPLVSVGLFSSAYCVMYLVYLIMSYSFAGGSTPSELASAPTAMTTIP